MGSTLELCFKIHKCGFLNTCRHYLTETVPDIIKSSLQWWYGIIDLKYIIVLIKILTGYDFDDTNPKILDWNLETSFPCIFEIAEIKVTCSLILFFRKKKKMWAKLMLLYCSSEYAYNI